MMWRYLAIVTTSLFLVACSFKNHSESYPHAASSVPPIKKASGINAAKFEDTYPMPGNVMPATGASPSVLPPGSNLGASSSSRVLTTPVSADDTMRGFPSGTVTNTPYGTQNNTAAAASSNQQTVNTQPRSIEGFPTGKATIQSYIASLSVNGSFEQTWQKVGAGIQKAGYQILDKDESLGSYYILNKQATQGKITQTTPIVQIHLEKQDSTTKITVLNERGQALGQPLTTQILQSIQAKGQL